MRGQSMFSKNKFSLLLAFLGFLVFTAPAFAEEGGVANVSAANLPINVTDQAADTASAQSASAASSSLVSPSQAQSVEKAADAASASPAEKTAATEKENSEKKEVQNNSENKDNFDFDLKMKSINAPTTPNATQESPAAPAAALQAPQVQINEADLTKDIQYKANPVENLGNSVLSQMDSDLFSQMSEIEKSTTLLTLELRREKIRNEIEAQKSIRQKNADDLERQRAEEKLRALERKKQIEAKVLQEQQTLLDKEKVFEALKQRKLLNAYMNHMLTSQQEWLKEKEALYARLAEAEMEKKKLIEIFKGKVDKVLEASAKNIQTAELARANFERIVKGLKARNEQLRKRIEADAKIIKSSKSNVYIKTPSIEELKDRASAAIGTSLVNEAAAMAVQAQMAEAEEEAEEEARRLSSEYAILGITGRAGVMSVDVIDSKGQPITLKVGSPLPTGHIVSEIGSDYVKFSRDGRDDYLYVGRTIDGIVPKLGAALNSKEESN